MAILRYYRYYYQCYAYEPLYVFMSARTTTSILTSRGRPSMMPDTQEAGRPQCGRPQCQLFGLPWGLLASEGFSFRTDRSSGFRVALSVGSKSDSSSPAVLTASLDPGTAGPCFWQDPRLTLTSLT